jgi:two-component system, NarL family, response regulator NreC
VAARNSVLSIAASLTVPVTAEDTITIVLADDHAVVRSSLRLLLDAEPDFDVVAEAGDVDTALRTVAGCKPSVLILDLNMPGARSSLEAIPSVAETSSGTRVVVLTVHEDPEFAHHALRAGALGYVLKDSAHGELVEAVRRASAGEEYVNPRMRAAPSDDR